MARIRRLTCFDYPKLKKLISYLCTDENDQLAKSLIEDSIGLFNAILPLALKFKSESFILVSEQEILGLITASGVPGNPYKILISRLIFKENLYEVGKQLIDFVLQKYGAMGATSFAVTIDECHTELFDLFINSCGFRQCASEILWKIEHPVPEKTNLTWRYAQNSDSKKIAKLYNDEIISMYKPSLLRNEKEFQTPFFTGMSNFYKARYITEESSQILGYYSVTTTDNLNYIIDINTNSGYDVDYEKIIQTLLCEIASKKRAFYPLIKLKNYVKNAQTFENYLKSKSYNPIQTQQILVKDFYKPVYSESKNWKVFLLGENQITSS